ncbi:MAG: ribbon-helix-helix domain-containing protein [Bacillota bacterium]
MDVEDNTIKTTIYLRPEQVNFLDKLAQEEGVTRLQVVQSIFDEQLEFYMTWKIFFG